MLPLMDHVTAISTFLVLDVFWENDSFFLKKFLLLCMHGVCVCVCTHVRVYVSLSVCVGERTVSRNCSLFPPLCGFWVNTRHQAFKPALYLLSHPAGLMRAFFYIMLPPYPNLFFNTGRDFYNKLGLPVCLGVLLL